MRFLYKPLLSMKRGTTIKVTFSKPTKVKLLSNYNFELYKKGRTHDYFGGDFDSSPIEMVIPSDGNWNCVIEKGTFSNPLNVIGNVEITGFKKKKRKKKELENVEALGEAQQETQEDNNSDTAVDEAGVSENPE